MPSPTPENVTSLWSYSSKPRLAAAVVVGLLAWAVDRAAGPEGTSLLVGWDLGVAVYIVWVFSTTLRLDGPNSSALAHSKGPDRRAADLAMLAASLASLGGVGLLLLQAAKAHKGEKDLLAGIGVASVACSWLLVHTLYTEIYARLYYDTCEGAGIDFNDDDKPSYADFAYLAFTVGMTYQVSDTDIKDKRIRRAVLHQAALAYLFGTVIVATTINLVAGLGGK